MSEQTTSEQPRFSVPKSEWGPGPWQDEPDHVAFVTKNGMPAICHRNHGGAWCGYVAVQPGHPLHGKSYLSADRYELGEDGELDYDRRKPGPHVDDLRVHGGITYAGACAGEICHVPAPGEPDNVHWLGFDCSHGCDVQPADVVYWRGRGMPSLFGGRALYRDLAYVREECESLAEQLAALVKS